MRMRMRGAMTVLAAGALALTACSGAGSGDGGGGDTEAPASATPAFAIDQDFPDPDVLRVGDTYYAYATNSPAANLQYATSTDLETWQVAGDDAFPDLPAWADEGRTWAPDVTELADGRFALYFTAQDAESGQQCIGAATADAPTGPFVGASDAPLICPLDEGGAIDASSFTDADGTRYLVWKNDGNCCGLDTWLQIAELSVDGTTLVGETTKLLMQDQPWEGNLIEAPTLVKREGVYALLYSANDYGGDAYATGYATAPSVRGPFTKGDAPLLTTEMSDGRYLGPGGQDVVTAADGSDVLVFHSWDSLFIQRGVNVVPLTWDDGVPSV